VSQQDPFDNSYLVWYWVGWPIVVGMMIVLRVTVLWSAPANIRVFSFLLYGLGVTSLVMITLLYESGRVLDYLKRHHPALHTQALKPHWSQRNWPYPVWSVMFSSATVGDQTFERLRSRYCALWILWICVFLTLPCLCGVFAM
jgi:REP element-mobilizing transposase RayT